MNWFRTARPGALWGIIAAMCLLTLTSGCSQEGSPAPGAQAQRASARAGGAATDRQSIQSADAESGASPHSGLQQIDGDPELMSFAGGVASAETAAVVELEEPLEEEQGALVAATLVEAEAASHAEMANHAHAADDESSGHLVADPLSQRGAELAAAEPLFVDWPKPKLALVITGRQYGYLEPCGCSGLDNQKGGLVRRSTLIKQLKSQGWPVLPLDAGNQVRRFGRQAEVKFQFTLQGLSEMGYRAIAFGPDDLRLPASELYGILANVQPKFVAANIELYDALVPYLVVEEGGKRVGITAVLGERNQKEVHNDEITMRPAADGIRQVWPQMQQAKCDLYVLIAHATTEESIALGKQFPQFKLVITTGGAGEPPIQPDTIAGTTSLLVDVGTKGMFAGVVGLFGDGTTSMRYQRAPLDARFVDSVELLETLQAYQDQLKEIGFEGLGVKPLPMPGGGEFIGSEVCKDCHEEEYSIWKDGLNGHEGRHAHAYATLLNPPKRSKIARNHDPECLSCHVVGWNPQRYHPYASGFESIEKTPELINVGCENCHGPGRAHSDAENGLIEVEEDEMKALRQQQILELKDAEKKCLECHDLDNSPAFQEEGAFQRYWDKIKHGKNAK